MYANFAFDSRVSMTARRSTPNTVASPLATMTRWPCWAICQYARRLQIVPASSIAIASIERMRRRAEPTRSTRPGRLEESALLNLALGRRHDVARLTDGVDDERDRAQPQGG